MKAGADDRYERQLAEAMRFLRENDRFLVVSHVSPDGDAVSSTLAVGWLLKRLNKSFTLVNEDPVPEKLKFLCGDIGEILQCSALPPDVRFDRVISVDCADFARLGKAADSFAESYRLLNIDHHATNDAFGHVNLLRTDAAATAEILHDLVQTSGLAWTQDVATCIYAGLLTDTGGFRYSNTTPNVLRIASAMMKHGVRANELSERLLERLSRPQIELLRKALASLTMTDDGKIAWVTVTAADMAESGALSEDTEGLVNYPRNIEGVEVGLLFKEVGPEQFKVSLRSTGAVDVSAVAKALGGGGHARAAGCTLTEPLERVIARVVEKVRQALA